MSEEMKKTKEVKEEDAWEIYLLLEEMNRFLHQPTNYESVSDVVEWLKGGVYERIRHAYYDIGGEWFPVDDETGNVIGPDGKPPPGD